MTPTLRRLSTLALVALAACAMTRCGSPAQPSGPAPAVNAIAPGSATFGDLVTITGSGFLTNSNALKVGEGYMTQIGASDGSTVRFALAQTVGACPPTAQVCITLAVVIAPGTYQVSVVNANGTSNTVALQIRAQ